MKILLFSSSLRKESLNTKLIKLISKQLLKRKDLELHIADIKILKLPVYDGDIESEGIPQGVSTLGALISNADAIVISSPEYNGSIAAPLKNLIDWVSRLKPTPWANKPIFLSGASPGAYGAIRSFTHERVPLDTLGAFVFPKYFGLAKADSAFDHDGNFIDAKYEQRLDILLDEFIVHAKRLKSI